MFFCLILYSKRLLDNFASAGVIGHTSLAITTFLASLLNLGIYTDAKAVLLPVALVNGGLTQFICGMFYYEINI